MASRAATTRTSSALPAASRTKSSANPCSALREAPGKLWMYRNAGYSAYSGTSMPAWGRMAPGGQLSGWGAEPSAPRTGASALPTSACAAGWSEVAAVSSFCAPARRPTKATIAAAAMTAAMM